MKKVRVIGPRILLKVKKFKVQDVEKIEGSLLVRAVANTEVAEMETIHQTVGYVEQLGNLVSKHPELADIKIGDKVHFSRYGARQLKSISEDDTEYWLIMAADILIIEESLEA